MASVYSPGLKVVAKTNVHKERRLPMLGDVHVKKGDVVKAEQVVASTYLPGNVTPLNLANQLGCDPKEINDFLKKKTGDNVEKGEMIAETPGILGFFKTRINAPIGGLVETISTVTGQVIFREPPIPVEVLSYVDGEIEEVYPGEGVRVLTTASYIQGIFGIGPEVIGPLEIVAKNAAEVLDAPAIISAHIGKIIVGGSLVTAEALRKAVDCKVKGIVVGGIDAQDLKEFLGYDLGVAITGTEDKGITVVITEGFGKIEMAQKTFDLLVSCKGRKTSINGATQIRAGVIRPEVVIPLPGEKVGKEEVLKLGMAVGGMVRIIREPRFGEVAKIVSLPEKPQMIPTEAKVRVVEIQLLKSGEKFVLPRANVEIIEE
mgnify:FL=1